MHPSPRAESPPRWPGLADRRRPRLPEPACAHITGAAAKLLIQGPVVARPGSASGVPKRLGLLPYFATLLELSPADHVSATINQGDNRAARRGRADAY